MKIINSERLSYRLMDENDGDELFLLDQDPEVMRFITGGELSSREKIDSVFIPRMLAYRTPEKGWGLWRISITATDEYLGWVLVRPMQFFSDTPELDNLELGWRFFRTCWGKGYASEAAKHIKQALAADTNIKSFSAIADKDNLGSIGVMKNLGMKYVKSYHHIDSLIETDVVHYQVANNIR